MDCSRLKQNKIFGLGSVDHSCTVLFEEGTVVEGFGTTKISYTVHRKDTRHTLLIGSVVWYLS
jgi:hypothetical protein